MSDAGANKQPAGGRVNAGTYEAAEYISLA
jgi:hypothetical protein